MASKSPAAAGRTGRRRGQPHTRQQILDAARELFAERGYAGTSMRAIGAAAGVDPALVHHYFGTKEELFRAVLDVPVDPEVLLRQIGGASGAETPARFVQTFLPDAEARVALVVSQMLGVVLLRRVVALEPLASMPVEQLTAALVPTIARYLDGALPARPTQDPPSTARPASNHRERKPTP